MAVRFVRRGRDIAWGLAGLGLFIACALVANRGTVGVTEQHIFRAINGLPDTLTPAMDKAQILGVLAVGPIAALFALALRRWRLAAAFAIVTVAKLLTERLVWQVVQRDRPGTTEPVVHVRGSTPSSGISFVSGHVMLVSGLAWSLTPYLRGRWKLAPWAVVVLVAFARVYLGAHNPIDVLGGFALGITIGAAANLAVGAPELEEGATEEAGAKRAAGAPPRPPDTYPVVPA